MPDSPPPPSLPTDALGPWDLPSLPVLGPLPTESIVGPSFFLFGKMRWIGEFSHTQPLPAACKTPIVLRTARGEEVGEPLVACNASKLGLPGPSRNQIEAYVTQSGEGHVQYAAGQALRVADGSDLTRWRAIQERSGDRLRLCRELAGKLGLVMKLLECEEFLAGDRTIFYYTAPNRVDFRSLVRELASRLRGRIDMRQVVDRDAARLVADYEICGREVCCRNFLKVLKPVTAKMARLQKGTVDPAMVSGRCGRLRCCLRFEQSQYEQLDASLPRVGAKVCWEGGEGEVVDRQVMTQLVLVKLPDGGRMAVAVEDLIDAPHTDPQP